MFRYEDFLRAKQRRVDEICDQIMELEQELDDLKRQLADAEDETFDDFKRDRGFDLAKFEREEGA